MYIEWSDTLNTGVGIVDAQHRHLVALINELYAGIGAGQVEPTLDRLFGEFSRYADEHFGTEERLLKRHAPDAAQAAAHLAAHDDYRRRIDDLRHRRNAHERFVPIQTLAFVSGWWLAHIAYDDRIYATLAADEPAAAPTRRERPAR